MTQIELWNTTLTPLEIQELGKCIKPSVRSENRIVTWGSRAWQYNKMKPLKDIPLNEFCEENYSNIFIWPEGITFNRLEHFCGVLDGKINYFHT